ncbi:MAG: alkaline phosphatase [Pirellulaceae bacterium]|jgi:alkaline phosphatase|nr:metallophosphoesterase [Thermoguttaceae bacterium]MDI9446883.1 metallophosphoesterase [Planctomycetota bacterium]NLY99851.1 alkaline phosphatase [Pirellulaceae bacterium]
MATCRRRFLKRAAMGVVAIGAPFRLAAAQDRRKAGDSFAFGLVADVHYAGTAPRGSRYYRDSAAKLAAAVDVFRREQVAFVVELGDLVDAGPSKTDELGYLETVCGILGRYPGPTHFVLGNHCVEKLTKTEFLTACGRDPRKTYYSFDHGSHHFVVLDADYLEDGTPYGAGNFSWTDSWIPAEELRWLEADLAGAADRQTVVFIHQNLHNDGNPHAVKNAPQVRKVLEEAGSVIAVFQGHMHTGGGARIRGVAYRTLRAMVEGPGIENNAFAVVRVTKSRIDVQAFGKMPDGF